MVYRYLTPFVRRRSVKAGAFPLYTIDGFFPFSPGRRTTAIEKGSFDACHLRTMPRAVISAFTRPKTGGRVSYLSSYAAGGLVFAALSMHVPDTAVFGTSGPRYVTAGAQECSPEVASEPLNETVSARLNQPLGFGWRSGLASTVGGVASYLSPKEAPPLFPALSVQLPPTSAPRSAEAVTPGGEASRRTITVEVTEPCASDAVHETPVPPVSWEMVVGAHAWDHDTVTSPVCQAPQSAGPGEHDG